ncbi:hypothetical protein [Mycobacteroides abscessus]|nr:hypothetical protein [Mycobacteroides abscessus]MDO3312537.1 hypothetical protein [Mycobacteroides abscessus subsp. abscessus]MDO3344781.1 hypothetical protein [Mycobacteroides abscessus subsp. abscessus]QOF39475.1 hypothetical protein E3G66_003679 [Mycobacteroides abscessus]SHP04570.1 Uncharacterised protein [Mycobacteroides abscessus subsp. abscessus]SHP19382.1 Uncharacterised protein [Mycobacteroides abscessus subsp. abscessus]
MSGYTFQLRDMDPQAREKAAGAAKKTLHMKDGAGAAIVDEEWARDPRTS